MMLQTLVVSDMSAPERDLGFLAESAPMLVDDLLLDSGLVALVVFKIQFREEIVHNFADPSETSFRCNACTSFSDRTPPKFNEETVVGLKFNMNHETVSVDHFDSMV